MMPLNPRPLEQRKTHADFGAAHISKYASILAAGCLCLSLLSGCDMYGYGKIGGTDENFPGTMPAQLYGQWVYADECYTITGSPDTIKYEYTGGSPSPFDFEGTI
jgi:hypothetical protein